MPVEIYPSDLFGQPGGQARNPANRDQAVLRVCRFQCAALIDGAPGSTFRLCTLPQRGRYLSHLSLFGWSGFGAGRVLSLGWEAYTGLDGLEVPADPAGLGSGLSVAVDGRAFLNTLNASIDEWEAVVPVVLTATISGGTVAAGSEWGGIVVYASAH